MTEEEQEEWLRCSESPLYFVHKHCQVDDPQQAGEWIPFRLWPAQASTLKTISENKLTIVLKARQLGFSWLVLAFALWLMLFRASASILIFSRRDDEAVDLLKNRMKKMYKRLPSYLQADSVEVDNDHEWRLSNESIARAFPTSAGDSYTATLAIVDEADLVPDLNQLMRAVKPTIDNGGRMILVSRSDKKKPASEFKQIYRGAKQKKTDWVPVFVPWYGRPGRTMAWYRKQKTEILARTGYLDDLHEQYPATDDEALAPSSADKRIPETFLKPRFFERDPISLIDLPEDAPIFEALEVYQVPQPGHQYVIGADPAEGNPTSDPSALTVLDMETGEEVAALSARLQPAVFAAAIDAIGKWYNNAQVLVERNNHGHAVQQWIAEHSRLKLIHGRDGKDGWISTPLGNVLLYDGITQALREAEILLHSLETYLQLASIEGSTLSAPEGEHDDRADSIAIAHQARLLKPADPDGEIDNDVDPEIYKPQRRRGR
jgi:hypothetical protein